jgi:hypothetical protein
MAILGIFDLFIGSGLIAGLVIAIWPRVAWMIAKKRADPAAAKPVRRPVGVAVAVLGQAWHCSSSSTWPTSTGSAMTP